MPAGPDATPDRWTGRLVFLHGFTQTHHHWHRVAFELDARLPDRATLVFPDLPGHGVSGAADARIEHAAHALTAICGPGTYLGYSMGARHALVAACSGAPEIERLVLVGGTPGIVDAAERGERVASDEGRARQLEADGVEAFVDAWTAMPMFDGLPHDPDGRRHRLRNTEAGLAASLRSAGTGVQPDLWPRLGEVRIPVLVLAGGQDDKFAVIGRRMAELLPHGEFVAIADAGHAAHLERTTATVDAIAAWLTA